MAAVAIHSAPVLGSVEVLVVSACLVPRTWALLFLTSVTGATLGGAVVLDDFGGAGGYCESAACAVAALPMTMTAPAKVAAMSLRFMTISVPLREVMLSRPQNNPNTV